MDSGQPDVVQQILDAISRLPEDDQEKVGRKLSELIDNMPELPLEGDSMASVDRAVSLCPSSNRSDSVGKRKQQHPPTSTVRPEAGVSTGGPSVANKCSIEKEGKTDGGSDLDNSSLKAVRGSRATLDIFDVQAIHVPNPGDLQSKEKNTVAAGASGSSDLINNRLLKPLNAYEPKSKHLLSGDHLDGRVDHRANSHTPGLYLNTGVQSPASPVVPTMMSDEYNLANVYGQAPFVFPNSLGIQTTSFQGNSVLTPFPYPPVPMPYPSLPAVFPPGYRQLPIPVPSTSTGAHVPLRTPFGNSQWANLGLAETPRASEAGPSRAGRKGSKKAAHKEAVVYTYELPDCPLPGKQFYDKRELLRHQKYTKAHSEDKFPCPVCRKQIGRKDAVKRHMKNIHKRCEVLTES